MKTTIYELLGMIKDGKAPKKIMYDYKIYEYQGDDYLYKDEDKHEHWLFSESYTEKEMWLDDFLNEPIVILETTITYKQDKIKKLEEFKDLKQEIANMHVKIDEIIEAINER